MNALESQLDPETFFRIHRSHIVNIERVKELQPWFNGEYVVFLRNGTQAHAQPRVSREAAGTHRAGALNGSSQLSALSSRLSALGSQLSALSSRLSALG